MAWLFIRVDSYSQQPPMGIFLPAFGASACRGSMEKEWRGEGERERERERKGKNFMEMCLQMRVHLTPDQKFGNHYELGGKFKIGYCHVDHLGLVNDGV